MQRQVITTINNVTEEKKKEKKEEKRKRKENTELQKPNVDAEVYNNNKKCD